MQCRVCRRYNCKETMDMSYVVPTDGKTLYEYFNDCTQLKATNKDDLPTILCMNCTQNLQQAYNFRQEALNSDLELKRTLLAAINKTRLVPDATNDQTEKVKVQNEQDTESSTLHLISISPKRETEFVYDPELSNVPQSIEDVSTIDPLSAPEQSEQNATVKIENQDESKIMKEVKTEPSNDMFEYSIGIQLDDDKVDNIEDYESSQKKPFECGICIYKNNTKKELKKHIFELHKDAILCHECPKVFELPSDTQMHKKLVHDTETDMCCPWCKNSKPMQKDILAKHLQKNHTKMYLKYFPRLHMLGRDASFQCERCPKVFKSIYELADHVHDHKFYCPICPMSFRNTSTHNSHLKRIHNTSITKLNGGLNKNDEAHLSDQHKESLYVIKGKDDKNGTADNTNRKQVHRNNEVNSSDAERNSKICDELVECKHCHKKIPTRIIAAHEKRHGYRLKQQRKCICSYCPREFKCVASVKYHEQKVHLCEGKPEQQECPICKKVVDVTYLKRHIAHVHAAERTIACDICGDLFKSSSHLISHKLLHLNRKYPCTVCNKKFIRQTDLKVHMRMHTGEVPYQCHLCERRFKIKGALNYHLQRHAGIKRKCDVCGKEYNSIVQLKIHSYTHTGMPYRCPVCDYGCVKRLKFRTHLQNKHDKTLTEDELSAMFKANTGRYPRIKFSKDLEIMDEIISAADSSNCNG